MNRRFIGVKDLAEYLDIDDGANTSLEHPYLEVSIGSGKLHPKELSNYC